MNLHVLEWFPRESSTPRSNAHPQGTPVILFLHGMGGTGAIWRPIAAQLEDHYFCVAPDQRGHGLSQQVPDTEQSNWKATDYARDVKQLILARGWKEVLLIGHSMGARTALALGHLALQEPELAGALKHVVCVDIGLQGAWGGGMGKPLADFLQNLPREFGDRKTLREYLLANCPDPSIAQYLSAVAKNISPVGKPEVWAFPFDHERVVETIHQANAALAPGLPPSQQETLPVWTLELVQAGIPVTFLRGANSRVWLKEDYEQQRVQYHHPLLDFQEWENCGHGLPFEQRARFVTYLKSL